MSQLGVTMVVVSWNVRESLRRCLLAADAVRGTPLRIVVIDNASADGSAEMVKIDFPNIRLIANRKNLGFAAAVNQGLEGSEGHIFLVNPDVELRPETISVMLDHLAKYPRAGIVGPKLMYPDGSHQRSVKRFPRWIDLALILSKLPNLFPPIARHYQIPEFNYNLTQLVDQVMGSCFFIRRETLKQVGQFDENYWIWFEEVDYCMRAKVFGWETWYVAETTAIHGRGQSFQQVSIQLKQGYLRNSIRHFVSKHCGAVAKLALTPLLGWSWLSGWIIGLARLQKPIRSKEL